jgi:hypothetical protein
MHFWRFDGDLTGDAGGFFCSLGGGVDGMLVGLEECEGIDGLKPKNGFRSGGGTLAGTGPCNAGDVVESPGVKNGFRSMSARDGGGTLAGTGRFRFELEVDADGVLDFGKMYDASFLNFELFLAATNLA